MVGIKAGPTVAADDDPAKSNVAVGGYVCSPEAIDFHEHLNETILKVRNTGDRPVQVGSHFHFFEVNRALEFDRAAAFGQHLNIPASTALRFEPGDEREVKLVPNNLVDGATAGEFAGPQKAKAVALATQRGFRSSPEER